MGVPLNGWFIREHHIKMDDLGVPSFSGNPHTCICDHIHRCCCPKES
jgi:hypothetical protein